MKQDLDAYDRPQFEQSLPHHTIRDSGYESHLLWRLERGKKEGGGHLKNQLALQRSDDRKRQQTQQGHTPMADRCDDEGNGGFLITLAPFPENNNSATTTLFPPPPRINTNDFLRLSILDRDRHSSGFLFIFAFFEILYH